MQPFASRTYDMAARSAERSSTKQRLVAIARVYSGKLKVGGNVYVFGANHSPENPDVTQVNIPHLFLLMGQVLEPVK